MPETQTMPRAIKQLMLADAQLLSVATEAEEMDNVTKLEALRYLELFPKIIEEVRKALS